MANPEPLQYGLTYHIFNRGNNGETIFREERNYRHFLQLYAQHVRPIADTYAYCLLPHHFHLLVSMKEESSLSPRDRKPPSQHFSNLFNACARAFNRAHGRRGSLSGLVPFLWGALTKAGRAAIMARDPG